MAYTPEDLYFRYKDENHELRKQQRELEQRVKMLTAQLSRQQPGQMRSRSRVLAESRAVNQETLRLSHSIPAPPSPYPLSASFAPSVPPQAAATPAPPAAAPVLASAPAASPAALATTNALVARVETMERDLHATKRDLEISRSQNFAVSVAEELAALRALVKRLELSHRSEISQTPLGQMELENARLRAEAEAGRSAISLVHKLKEEKAILAEELMRSRKFLAQQLAINDELKKLRTSEADQFADREKTLLQEISRFKRLANNPGLTPVAKNPPKPADAGNPGNASIDFPIQAPPGVDTSNALEILISKGKFQRAEFLNREDSVLVFSLAPLISDQLLSAVGRGVRPAYDSAIVFPLEISDGVFSFMETKSVQIDLHLLPSEKKIAHGNIELNSLLKSSGSAFESEISLFAVNDASLLVATVTAKFRLRENIRDALDAWRLRKQIKN